jgi:hypothetical protein
VQYSARSLWTLKRIEPPLSFVLRVLLITAHFYHYFVAAATAEATTCRLCAIARVASTRDFDTRSDPEKKLIVVFPAKKAIKEFDEIIPASERNDFHGEDCRF